MLVVVMFIHVTQDGQRLINRHDPAIEADVICCEIEIPEFVCRCTDFPEVDAFVRNRTDVGEWDALRARLCAILLMPVLKPLIALPPNCRVLLGGAFRG